MDRPLKILIPSIVALIVSLIFYLLNIPWLNNYLFITSSIIQVLTFVYWVFEDKNQKQIQEALTENIKESKEINKGVKEVREYQIKKDGLLEKRQRLLSNLIKNGAIPTKEIYKIIKSMRKRGMFIVSNFGGNNLDLKGVLQTMGEEKISIVPKILYNLGFKRIYKNENVFIILKEDLPPKLRKSEELKKIILGELITRWNFLQDFIIKKGFSKYDKWKDGRGFHCNLCIFDIEEGETTIFYKRLKNSDKHLDYFSEDFKGLLASHNEKSKIGQLIKDKIKAEQILDKLTISFLCYNLPEKTRDVLIKNELEITKKLNITKFLEISNLTELNLTTILKEYLNQEDVKDTVDIILKEKKEYVEIVKELNLFK